MVVWKCGFHGGGVGCGGQMCFRRYTYEGNRKKLHSTQLVFSGVHASHAHMWGSNHMWHRCSAPVRSQGSLDTCEFSTPSRLSSPTLRSLPVPSSTPWKPCTASLVVDQGKVRAVLSVSRSRGTAEEEPLWCYKSPREPRVKQLWEKSKQAQRTAEEEDQEWRVGLKAL